MIARATHGDYNWHIMTVRRYSLSLLLLALAVAAQTPTGRRPPLRRQPEDTNLSSARFILFDLPGATQTYPTAINSSGTVTGFYADAAGGHGFLRAPDGTLTVFDAPASQNIYPSSINSAGAVAGNYSSASQHGFLRTPDGAFVSFDVPGTFPSSSGNPIVINDAGVIAGPYFDGAHMHGFLRTADGTVTTLDAPNSTYTYATGINNNGAVTGIYADASFNSHGFVRGNDGTWVAFAVPGGNFGFFPPPLSIDDAGIVVGSYFQSVTHGFLRHLDGTFLTFDVAGAAGTQPAGINSTAAVGGSYQDSTYAYHGFLRMPSGVVYKLSVPGASATFGVGINDSGLVVGSYQDANFASHGFLLGP